jgi:hypothetical protein
MRHFNLLLPFLIPASAAAAYASPFVQDPAPNPKIEAYSTSYGTSFVVNAAVTVLPDEPLALFASWQGSALKPIATAIASPEGKLQLSAPFKPDLVPDDFELTLTLAVMRDGKIMLTDSKVSFGIATGCETLDFDYTLGQDEPVKGEALGVQWADVGVFIATFNNTPGHPDLGIIFDSSAPSGSDFDLATPGPGVGNDTALGNLMIVAENDVDADADELVDDPDDEAGGGVIRFDFKEAWEICSATLVDTDDSGPTELRFYTDILGPADVIPVMNLGDNSVQTVKFEKAGIVRFEVAFGGSGGLAHFDAVPCPRRVDFDERTLGAPLELETGEEITDQFSDIGLLIEAHNNVPKHPDKAILFDTANPTGGDGDLVTPGYGPGNDTALGKVLIIAENDQDFDLDGLVDDPDDEAGGGDLQFRFDTAVEFTGAKILDVDGTEKDSFNLYDENDNLILSVPIPFMGDNSVQTLTLNPPIPGVHRAELILGGSGAVTQMIYCPEKVTAP